MDKGKRHKELTTDTGKVGDRKEREVAVEA